MHYPETTQKASYSSSSGKGIQSLPALQSPKGSQHILTLAQLSNPNNQHVKLKQQSELLAMIAQSSEHINELKSTYGNEQVKYLANQTYRNFIEQAINQKHNYANNNSQNKLKLILEKAKRLRDGYGITDIHDLEKLVMHTLPEGTTQENRSKLYTKPFIYNPNTKMPEIPENNN